MNHAEQGTGNLDSQTRRRLVAGASSGIFAAMLGPILAAGRASAVEERSFNARNYLQRLAFPPKSGFFEEMAMRTRAAKAAGSFSHPRLASELNRAEACYPDFADAFFDIPPEQISLDMTKEIYRELENGERFADFINLIATSDFSKAPGAAPSPIESELVSAWASTRARTADVPALAPLFGEGPKLEGGRQGLGGLSIDDIGGVTTHAMFASIRSAYTLSFSRDSATFLEAIYQAVYGGVTLLVYAEQFAVSSDAAIALAQAMNRGHLLVGTRGGRAVFEAPGPVQAPPIKYAEAFNAT